MPQSPIFDNWSIDRLAGQRLMVGFDGTRFDDHLAGILSGIEPGGLILFRRNVESPEQLRTLCADAQDFARSIGLPPLLISIDQEGGTVARLGPPFTVFPGNPAMETLEDADFFGRTSARELLDVGIQMNLAPVMDVAPPGEAGIMEARVFRGGPDRVAAMGRRAIRAMQEGGLLAVAKHFPGIGRTVLDSHEDLPRMAASLAEMESMELPPFRAAVEAGVAGIMLSHILYPALDPRWPASLSPAIARDLLREELGFSGLVLTDDLDMGAIHRHYSLEQAIPQILASEIDLILICHPGPAAESAKTQMARIIREREDDCRRAAESVSRILAAKQRILPEASGSRLA
ncbi:MAG: glycoside hydrolase family 3 N-terminal domain-containing protein [Desulfococcaceae bacterium]